MHLSGGSADTPNRVASRDGLRGRWMAPVFGLVISFLSVLLLGAVVGKPAATTTSPPAADEPSVDVRLLMTKTEQGRMTRVPATGLGNVKVLVGRPQDLAVGKNGEVDGVTSGDSLTICVRLPEGWSAAEQTAKVGLYTCWEKESPDDNGPIELVVTPPEAK